MCVANAGRNVGGKSWKKCVWQMLEEMCVANAGRNVWQMLEEMCVANAGRNVYGKC